ncbi:MAG: bifunctional demethylmenaquinone methyltransferase/2-methoxy-6-polyprenyl-1,4-benzoquinol methylase UbiE [Planctomycetia bacterium]|nr:bifunctional demethylmenaquinone methyltransferase/2-methoxy-6-polyprenyl-1,4-benzoquinol methylase UbiE [Planctomycetia bacterium]
MTVDKSAQRIRTLFREIAPKYDFLNHLLSCGVDRYWRTKTVRRTANAQVRRVLDVCTGTADLALAYDRVLRRLTKGEHRIIGTDFCDAMIESGRRKIARIGNGAQERIELRVADTLHLPFEDDQFDLVSVAFGLRNVVDTDAGIREMTRVCRPGGTIAILEFTTPRNRIVRWGYLIFFRRILPLIGQCVARNRQMAYHYLPESVAEFPQYGELLDRMRRSGITDCQMTPMTLGIATLYTGVRQR